MKMFIDTANVDHIREANDLGVICGVTTNPSLIAKEGREFPHSAGSFPTQSNMIFQTVLGNEGGCFFIS